MDFNKPIYGEVEGFIDASAAKAYFKNHGIEYTEQVDDGYYVGSFYVFKFPTMTKEQLERASKKKRLIMREKRCGDCVNNENGTCENWDKGTGMPCSCAPPYDTACSNFSKNPADKNKPLNAMRRFTDNYWLNQD